MAALPTASAALNCEATAADSSSSGKAAAFFLLLLIVQVAINSCGDRTSGGMRGISSSFPPPSLVTNLYIGRFPE